MKLESFERNERSHSMKRKSQKAMALLTVTALSISSVFTMPASAKSAKPKLSKKRITMWAGTKKK